MFEIGAALASFNAIKQLGRGLYEAKVDADVKEKAREILDKLGDAQDVLYALREELLRMQGENADLRRQIGEADRWASQVGEYTMMAAAGGAMVLHHNTVPGLFACPACASARKLVPLQDLRNRAGTYVCPGCKAHYPVKEEKPYRELPSPRADYF